MEVYLDRTLSSEQGNTYHKAPSSLHIYNNMKHAEQNWYCILCPHCRKRCSNSHSKHQLFENKWSVEPFSTVEEEWETTCVFLHTASLNRLQIKMYTLGNSLLCIFLNYPFWIRLLVWEVSPNIQQPFQRSLACAFISCEKKKSQKGHFQFLRGIGKQK